MLLCLLLPFLLAMPSPTTSPLAIHNKQQQYLTRSPSFPLFYPFPFFQPGSIPIDSIANAVPFFFLPLIPRTQFHTYLILFLHHTRYLTCPLPYPWSKTSPPPPAASPTSDQNELSSSPADLSHSLLISPYNFTPLPQAHSPVHSLPLVSLPSWTSKRA